MSRLDEDEASWLPNKPDTSAWIDDMKHKQIIAMLPFMIDLVRLTAPIVSSRREGGECVGR